MLEGNQLTEPPTWADMRSARTGLSRLAVSRSLQGCGLGGQLLLAAGLRYLRVAEQAGGTVILIDAKNDRVAAWYAGYGAMPLLDAPLSLVLPLELVRKALQATGKLP